VTRGFMGPLGGFWPKLGRKRVTGWKQRSCVPPGRVKTNKQTIRPYFSTPTVITFGVSFELLLFLTSNVIFLNVNCRYLVILFNKIKV
jgi:hypothetical protein